MQFENGVSKKSRYSGSRKRRPNRSNNDRLGSGSSSDNESANGNIVVRLDINAG